MSEGPSRSTPDLADGARRLIDEALPEQAPSPTPTLLSPDQLAAIALAADASRSRFRREPLAVFCFPLLLQIYVAQSGSTPLHAPATALLLVCYLLATGQRVNDLRRFARRTRRDLRAISARSARPDDERETTLAGVIETDLPGPPVRSLILCQSTPPGPEFEACRFQRAHPFRLVLDDGHRLDVSFDGPVEVVTRLDHLSSVDSPPNHRVCAHVADLRPAERVAITGLVRRAATDATSTNYREPPRHDLRTLIARRITSPHAERALNPGLLANTLLIAWGAVATLLTALHLFAGATSPPTLAAPIIGIFFAAFTILWSGPDVPWFDRRFADSIASGRGAPQDSPPPPRKTPPSNAA